MVTLSTIASRNDGLATSSALVAKEIGVQFQGLAAISNVSLEVRKSEILGLIGPNGAGKTTFVNTLTGFQKPTSGVVLVDGIDTSSWTPVRFRKQGVARTFQAGRLFADLTVRENIEVSAISMGLSRKDAGVEAERLLDWLGIPDKHALVAGALPYTDQRRVGIARAMVCAPHYILLDEPAAGMSDSECEDLIRFVAEIPTRWGCGVLLIEHNMHVVMSISQRIHVLDGGKTIAEGTPDEIKRNEGVIVAYLGAEA